MSQTMIAVSPGYAALPPELQKLFVPYVPTPEQVQKHDGPVSSAILRLLKVQGNKCAICGGHMRLHGSIHNSRRATIDHVVPYARGGKNERNRLLAHRKCNAAKADRKPYPCELLLLAAVNERLSAGEVRG